MVTKLQLARSLLVPFCLLATACESRVFAPAAGRSDPIEIDGKEVARAQRLRFEQKDDRLIEDQPRYRAVVDTGRLAFAPRHWTANYAPSSDVQPPFIEGESVILETVRLARGRHEAQIGESVPVLGPDGEALIDRDWAVEQITNRDDGVEQSWYFERAPLGEGDLEVEVSVFGLEYAGETEHGHHFTGAEGEPGVRYGRAFWVDAEGVRFDLPVTYTAGSLHIRVPQQLLEIAVYPAVLDPVVFSEITFDTAVSGPASLQQIEPDIAFGGSTFLAVWADRRGGGGYDIVGSRISPAGVIQEQNGFLITSAVSDQRDPVVAYNGTEFLVVWSDLRDEMQSDLYAQRVSTAGALVGAEIQVTNTAEDETEPAIAALGGDWMVAFENDASGIRKTYAARVSSAGAVVDAPFELYPTGTETQRNPDIDCDGTDCLVAWQDGPNADEDIHGVRVSTGQVVREATPIIIESNASREVVPQVVYDGSTNYMVVWQDFVPPGTNSIFFNLVEAATGTVTQATPTTAANLVAEQRLPSAAFDGTNFFLAWSDRRRGGDDMVFSQVDTSGLRLESFPHGRSLDKAAGEQTVSAAAAGGGVITVVYESELDGKDIKFSQRLVNGDATSRTSERLSNSAQRFTNPAAVWVRGGHVVLYTDYEGFADNSADIKWVHVDYQGRVRGRPVQITNDAGVIQAAPAVAYNSDDDQILITWSNRSTGRWQIEGVRMDVAVNPVNGTLARTILDASPIAISDGTNGNQNRSRVAYNSAEQEYLVVWSDERSGNSGADIFGSRVSTAGVDLDASDFRISDGSVGGNQDRPDVASDGTDYLVVWGDDRGGGNNQDLYGSIVTGAGSPGSAFSIAVAAEAQDNPAVVYDPINDRYFVVWADTRDQLATGSDIRGRVISTSGTLLLAERILADSVEDEGRPDVWIVNDDSFLAAFTEGPETARIGAVRTGLDGVLDCTFDVADEAGRMNIPVVSAPDGPYPEALVTFMRFVQEPSVLSERVRARRVDVIAGACVP